MEKVIIQIGLEFIFGPILRDDEDENGNESSGSFIVDNDQIVNSLDKEINDLWCSLYSKDETNPDGLRFNLEKEKELAPKLLGLISNLLKRLDEINDGSFEVVDMVSAHLKSLL